MRVINKNKASHYQWGNACDAWTLLQSDGAIIKEENIPPSAGEILHYHQNSEQAFYILEGEATFFMESENYRMMPGDFIVVPRNMRHKICNESELSLRILLITFPGNINDRVNA